VIFRFRFFTLFSNVVFSIFSKPVTKWSQNFRDRLITEQASEKYFTWIPTKRQMIDWCCARIIRLADPAAVVTARPGGLYCL
jgi:hypothetical protein